MNDYQKLRQMDQVFKEHFQFLGEAITKAEEIEDEQEKKREARLCLRQAEKGLKKLRKITVTKYARPVRKTTVSLAESMTQRARMVYRGKSEKADTMLPIISERTESMLRAIREYVERTGGDSDV
ncbi:hypothetical protein [Pontibacillus salipaludis]|uniref:Uncharacterized protein n=1 Tax=Pontibacillus salipaludis TaxID=1697394 RepID=A0ABQ1PYM5_9BACI|nr:hypothetical protein [Pontibacillus salipaludis]GGD07705.1 hypothetical protein GCM10011389_14060 [Pontibacillus salipaludis]